MSNRVFQSVINQMKDATDRQIGVIDDQGYVVACNELSMIGTQLNDILEVNGEVTEQVLMLPERSYRLLGPMGTRFEFAAFVKGNDQMARSLCIVMGVALNEAKINYEEKYNKATFVKNIISDNILPGDVYARAKELRFVTDIPRAVLLVQQVDRTLSLIHI